MNLTIEEELDDTPYTLSVSPTYQACILLDGAVVADIRLADFHNSRTPDEARAAIAHLFAAAPELLAACQEAIERIVDLSESLECECVECPECGLMPVECSKTQCADTCSCSECSLCCAEYSLTFIRSAIAKAAP